MKEQLQIDHEVRLRVLEEVAKDIRTALGSLDQKFDARLLLVIGLVFTSIIIPVYFNSYQTFHLTGDCIGSIREHTNSVKTPYEIILVINGVTAIKLENLQQSYADKVITNEENLGFSKAVNKGIRVSKGEYIAIVNNDVKVFDHWLEDMQQVQQSGIDLVMGTPMHGEPFARAIEANKKREKTFQVGLGISSFTDFSCVLTTKDLFNKIGLFDERFYMYCEDLDLIRRIEKVGGKVASTKLVNTHHIGQATSYGIGETPEIMNKSKELLKSIWGY